jgi:hypothetical protein
MALVFSTQLTPGNSGHLVGHPQECCWSVTQLLSCPYGHSQILGPLCRCGVGVEDGLGSAWQYSMMCSLLDGGLLHIEAVC